MALHHHRKSFELGGLGLIGRLNLLIYMDSLMASEGRTHSSGEAIGQVPPSLRGSGSSRDRQRRPGRRPSRDVALGVDAVEDRIDAAEVGIQLAAALGGEPIG